MTLYDPQFSPGIYSEGTEYSASGKWVDGNLIRWHAGAIRPIGGWRKMSTSVLAGKPRTCYPWRTNALYRMSACGTHSNLYVITPSAIFDITPTNLASGRENTVLNVGYGVGYYDQGFYGTPRAESNAQEATIWHFSNFGEWLLAVNTTDGRLFVWDPVNTGSAAQVVASAPTNNTGVIVTPQRHVLLFGANGDKRKLHWSSSETINVWTPSALNSAGFLSIPSAEPCKAARVFRNGILIFTESSLYMLSYIGYPYIYSLSEVANGISVVSPSSIVSADDAIIWMGKNKFFYFDGAVREIPCSVKDFVFDKFNWLQAIKTFGYYFPDYSEIWWFFPSDSNENDRYVVLNMAEKIWYTGYVSRATGWFSPEWQQPILVSSGGIVYKHEEGYTDDGSPIGPQRYLVSSPIMSGKGESHYLVQGIVPDRDPSSAVGVVLEARDWPEVKTVLSSTGILSGGPYIDCRTQARAFAVKLVGITDNKWELGSLQLDVIPTGKRRK